MLEHTTRRTYRASYFFPRKRVYFSRVCESVRTCASVASLCFLRSRRKGTSTMIELRQEWSPLIRKHLTQCQQPEGASWLPPFCLPLVLIPPRSVLVTRAFLPQATRAAEAVGEIRDEVTEGPEKKKAHPTHIYANFSEIIEHRGRSLSED